MKLPSLIGRTAKGAVLLGLAIGANASNFNSRQDRIGASPNANSIAVAQSLNNGMESPSVSDYSGKGSAYGMLAGLVVMGAIALRRRM